MNCSVSIGDEMDVPPRPFCPSKRTNWVSVDGHFKNRKSHVPLATGDISAWLSNEAFEKLLVFVTVQNLVARKTYVLGTIQLNHIIPLNLVARETYVLETSFRPRFEKLKVFLNRLRGAKCRRAKNSRFSNHLFCQIWCGTKNSRFLNRFFP